jgi:hypothetical protein
MAMQHPPNLSRKTLILLLILYGLSVERLT